MSIFSKILNSIGYTRYSDGSHWYVDKTNTTFAGGDNLALALENPVLSAVLNIRANSLSKVKFYVEEKNGDKNFDDPSLDLIKNPNTFQSKEDFLKQYEWMRCAYGWVYQKPFGAVAFTPDALFNLNPSKIDFSSDIKTSSPWTQDDINKYLDKTFRYTEGDSHTVVKLNDIIPFYDIANGLKDCDTSAITSPSKITALIKQLSNIALASDAENVVIQTNGREMIFSDTGSDTSKTFGDSHVPMGKEDKQDISSKLNNKFLMKSGSTRTLTPDKKLGWIPMNIKAGDLGLHESINANASLVTQAFGVSNEIYQSHKTGATFENQEQAEIKFYQNVIQPVADDLASSWTSKFGDKNRPFRATFEHLPMMQTIEDKKTDKVAKVSKAFKDLTSAGMTTEESIAIMQSLGVNIEITKKTK